MAKTSLLKYLHLAHFSQPSHERCIYRDIRRFRMRSIVELGVGVGKRSQRMIGIALRNVAAGEVRYSGIDLFEARPADYPGMKLKQAHRLLRCDGAKVQLIPGDPFTALSRQANQLQGTDLVVIGDDQDPAALARAWFYLPRMLTENAKVYLESFDERHGETRFHRLDVQEITRLADAAKRHGQQAA